MTAAAQLAPATRERPILFAGPMVRAILDGRKTKTRRVVRPQPEHHWNHLGDLRFCTGEHDKALGCRGDFESKPCPYGVPGDRLWVKETIIRETSTQASFAADRKLTELDTWPWKRGVLSAIHCPRGLSRLTLEVTSVRVERLQSISEEDAKAEGVTPDADCISNRCQRPYRDRFLDVWDEINGERAPWKSNPWCWVVGFRRLP